MADAFSVKLEEDKARMRSLYGENRKIVDGAYDESCAVRCHNGTFVGRREDGIIAHKGIPFATPPVGELRWKAPVDAAADDGVYEAYYFGTVPRQDGNGSQLGSLYPQDEDCLFLNVWRADDGSTDKKPVMVWIHGGAFEIGGTPEPREEGCNFVRENPGVILVSIEYRLGVLGFFHLSHLPDGAEYADAQNLGLLDQVQACKWIHENIAGFGGDPDNVTIFGQSAGGGSVSLLPLVDGAQRYFSKVIAQSGSPVFTRSTAEAIACTNEVMEALGAKTVADLQGIDIDTIVKTAGGLLGLRVWAERDGRTVPLDPYEAYANGAAKDVTFLQGCTKDELGYFIFGFTVEGYNIWAEGRMENKLSQLTETERALVQDYLTVAKDVTDEYPASARLFDQIVFIAPLFRMLENQTRAGGRTYGYFFTPESSVPLIRSGHAIELSELFNHPEDTLVTGRQLDRTFSKTMRRMWVQFATVGDPSLTAEQSADGRAKEWPLYALDDRRLMILDEFDIHVEPESRRGLVDWDRTYFLTKYYCI